MNMNYRLGLIFLASLFLSFDCLSQQPKVVHLGSPHTIEEANLLPDDLTSERSLIIIDTESELKAGFNTRGSWKEFSQTVHKSIRKIGIDPIAYIHISDLFAGPEATNNYKSLLELRQVRNIILIKRKRTESLFYYEITIMPFSPTDIVVNGLKAWSDSNIDLNEIILKIARQVLRQELVRSNFLIPEGPEYLEDLPLFTGQKYETYPTRLQSLKLAVVEYERTSTKNIDDKVALSQIEDYNMEVDQKNSTLKEIMSTYPYKYEFTTESNIDALYKKGFQYVLMSLSSSSESVKQMLNYPTIKSETHHMTSGFNLDNKVELKKIPVDSYVTKYYIKQTIVKDIHTGKVWDADVTWDKGLENFIFNMKNAFQR